MRQPFALALAAVALSFAAVPALASSCAPREDAVAYLAQEYGESRQGIGLTSDGTVMEMFSSAETGTWTITVTRPDGTTCMIASGVGYEGLAERLDRGQPA